MERKMENRLRRAFTEEEPVSEQSVDRMVLLARMQWTMTNQKKRIGFPELLLAQLRFIGWKMWLFEWMIAFVPAFVLIQYMGLYVITPAKAVFFLSCLVVWVSMFGIIFIYRSSYYRMAEIEAASFFSIKYLLLSRILILFAGELAVIAGISAVMSVYAAFSFGSGMLYMLFFFGMCSNGMLVLLRRTVIERLCRYFLAYGMLLLAVMLWLSKSLPQFFDGTRKTWMILGSCILFGCCIYQGVRLVRQPEETAYA